MTDEPTSTPASEIPVVVGNSLVEIIGDREIVHVDREDGFIVVTAPRTFSEPQNGNTSPVRLGDTIAIGPELGTTKSSFSSFMREEYNNDLRGIQGLRMYDKMRRNDGAVYGSLLAVKAPINGATWFIQPGHSDPGKDGHGHTLNDLDREIAAFVALNLEQFMTYSWKAVLREALLMLEFGYYMFEKVWALKIVNGEERIILRKLAARHPLDVYQWRFDENGGPNAVDMYNSEGGIDHVRIPISKLVVFTHDLESGNLEGRSMLRSAYKHWFYAETAYKIDGIQKERHGIGIPIITLPIGFTPADKTLAHEIGRNLRTNESAHVVVPQNWEIIFAKLEGQPVSALETAQHHGKMIFQNVLAGALWGDAAQGASEAQMEMFYKSVRHIADAIADAMNQYVIPQLVDMNWPDIEHYPTIAVRKLGDTAEARTLSFALRNYVGAGIIQVDEPLEEWARETMNAPELDPSTIRQVATPQQAGPKAPEGPDVGPPRQSQAANQRQKPSSSAGRDGGGTGGGGSNQ